MNESDNENVSAGSGVSVGSGVVGERTTVLSVVDVYDTMSIIYYIV